MRDLLQGSLMLLLSVLTAIAFSWAIFLAPLDITFLGRAIWEWAIIIPVLLIVYLFLIVVAWIGWAMVTTPPAVPTVEKDQKEEGATV